MASMHLTPRYPVSGCADEERGDRLGPVRIKARQTPGSAAWANTSPRRLRLRSRAKEPITPLLTPSKVEPASTHRKFGSNKKDHMCYSTASQKMH